MKNEGGIFPLLGAIVAAGLVLSVVSGTHEHWIPILLALGVVGGLARSVGR